MAEDFEVKVGEFKLRPSLFGDPLPTTVARHLVVGFFVGDTPIFEINGLATLDGHPTPIGLGILGHKIQLYFNSNPSLPGETGLILDPATTSLDVIGSRPLSGLQNDLAVLEAVRVAMLTLNDSYNLVGSNSNAVAATILKALGYSEDQIDDVIDHWAPGKNVDIFSNSQIAQIRSVFGSAEYSAIKDEIKSISWNKDGTMVVETDNPGGWTADGWDSNGDGQVNWQDDDWGPTGPPPPRPSHIGPDTDARTDLAPKTSPIPPSRPPNLGGGGSGSGTDLAPTTSPIPPARPPHIGGGGASGSGGGTSLAPKTSPVPPSRPKPKTPPILLDLDGNGVKVDEISRSATFVDAGGDGLKHRTAWAGSGDGVLFFDADGDGALSQKREYVFTEWDPTASSDMEALRSYFDTNGDGKLTAADANFAQFRVLVTNADGSKVVRTLAQLGITEINLTEDATRIVLPDGSVIEGQTTFRKADRHRVITRASTDVRSNRRLLRAGWRSANAGWRRVFRVGRFDGRATMGGMGCR